MKETPAESVRDILIDIALYQCKFILIISGKIETVMIVTEGTKLMKHVLGKAVSSP